MSDVGVGVEYVLKGLLKFASQGYAACPLMLAEGNSTGSDLQNSHK